MYVFLFKFATKLLLDLVFWNENFLRSVERFLWAIYIVNKNRETGVIITARL